MFRFTLFWRTCLYIITGVKPGRLGPHIITGVKLESLGKRTHNGL